MGPTPSAELIAYVVAAVFLLRKYVPKVDGPWVLLATVVFAILLSLNAGGTVRDIAFRAFLAVLAAAGGVTGVGYVAEKAGGAMGEKAAEAGVKAASIRPPPEMLS